MLDFSLFFAILFFYKFFLLVVFLTITSIKIKLDNI